MSLSHAHCSGCHAHFSSVSTFDKHKRGTTGCHRPEDLRDTKGYRTLRLIERVSAGGSVWISAREYVPDDVES